VRHAPLRSVSSTSATGAALVPASCDNGAGALAAGPGAVSCADGSEPACDDGSTPARPAGITALVCPPGSEPESDSSEEATCEEGDASGCSDESEAPPEAASAGGSTLACEREP
jgi:hypothetical protein